MKNNISAILPQLRAVVGNESCLTDEPMAGHTTFRIGGPADCFLLPHSTEELRQLLSILKQERIPYFVMGNGSNLLVSDAGFRGAVISIGRNMSDIRINGTEVTAQAGAFLSAIAAQVRKASLAGFEFAGGIPGTLGGACVMNAGAYGGEMKQILKSVTCIDETGEIRTVPVDEMELAYRSSIFMKHNWVVTEAVMELSEGSAEEIEALTLDLRQRRTSKQPLEFPSAGSTFKRPEGYFAGKLIMDAGLRGYRVGGACVSEKHCGFVINDQNATAEDVCTLISDVQKIVKDKFNVDLVPEVRFLGEF